MKKLLLVTFFLVSSIGFSQQEIKIDIFDALALKTIEASYEYYIDEQSSVGLSALFNFEKQSADFRYNENRVFTPYFRHYFTTTNKWNFFGEAFMAINSGTKTIEMNGSPNEYKDYSDGALGVAVGYKYSSEDGLTIDGHIGIGRNLFSSFSPILVPRIGVNVGYQF